jgi:hypothetical protein
MENHDFAFKILMDDFDNLDSYLIFEKKEIEHKSDYLKVRQDEISERDERDEKKAAIKVMKLDSKMDNLYMQKRNYHEDVERYQAMAEKLIATIQDRLKTFKSLD